MTASRPARAMRGAGVILVTLLLARVPAIERQFAAALAAADDSPAPVRRSPPPRRPVDRRADPAIAYWFVARRASPDLPVAAADHAMMSTAFAPTSPALAVAALPPDAPPTVADPSVSERSADSRAADSPSLAFVSGIASARLPTTGTDTAGLATAAYARLADGDRRGAVRLFDAALAGDDPRAGGWRRQRDALTRRWSGSAYSIVRGSGPAGLAVEPVLGGGQSGGGIAFTPDPLARRPFALTGRGSVAHDDGGRSGFAAVGVAWHPLVGVTLAAERLIAVGRAARDDWTLRLAGGAERSRGRLRLTAYAEGGIIGEATYAAIQGRAAAIVRDRGVEFDPGAGLWASLQRDRTTSDRVDVGPGVIARAGGLAVEVDYRVRIAGSAEPGSGPVLTLSAAF